MAVTDAFLGPKAVGPQVGRFRHPRHPMPDATVAWCSGCGTCTRVCPHGVAIAEMNVRAKARVAQEKGVPLRDQIISRPEALGQLVAPFAGLANRSIRQPAIRWMLENMLGIDRRAPLPAFSQHSFRKQHADRCVESPDVLGPDRRWVAYFHGCSTNHYEPDLGSLAIRVLEELGGDVILPPQRCCGLPLQSNGLFNAARKYGESNIDSLLPFVRKKIPVVGTSTSCILELKHEYRAVLGLSGLDFDEVAEGCFDVFEFIVDELWELLEDRDLKSMPIKILYHPPCQLRSHGIGIPAFRVLRQIPDLEIVLSDSECCGIAGTYGVKKERFDVAHKVGQSLFNQVADSRVDCVISDSETCRWWISEFTHLQVLHPLEVLASSMGLSH
jgi:glycerol-3-phosphate dehydrogenase subunit C